MISFRKSAFILTATCAIGIAGSASAESNFQKVLRDTNGHIVRNTFGNCVLTNWTSENNECTGELGLSLDDRIVYFDFNKSNLTPQAIVKLDRLANIIAESKQVIRAHIHGYADKIGNESYNRRLSMRRAQVVRDYLAKKGLNTGVVDVRALGENNPVAKCDNVKARKALIQCLAPNRRVEIEVEYLK